jgi:hypothetical protein
MLSALLLLRSKTIDSYVEWGVEADHGAIHLYCDDQPYSVRVPIKPSTQFVAHTHPDIGAAYPSPNDINVAKKTGLCDLVVSERAAYLVHPDGTVEKVS